MSANSVRITCPPNVWTPISLSKRKVLMLSSSVSQLKFIVGPGTPEVTADNYVTFNQDKPFSFGFDDTSSNIHAMPLGGQPVIVEAIIE